LFLQVEQDKDLPDLRTMFRLGFEVRLHLQLLP
jgi:hypothetical protein